VIPRLLASFAVCALLLAAPDAGTAAPPAPALVQLTLRLPDLPGYEVINQPSCTPLVVDGGRFGLETISRFPHRGCWRQFQRTWPRPRTTPGLVMVMSAVLSFSSVEGAQAALHRPVALGNHLFGRDSTAARPVEPPIGDEAVMLDTETRGLTTVLWRSGALVGYVHTAAWGRDPASPGSDATRLAALQQLRMAAPTPVMPGDFDNLAVRLDDPSDVPVFWLGRYFPGNGWLPALRLRNVTLLGAADRRQGLRTVMTYARRRGGPTVSVTLLHPSAFARPALRRELRQIRRDPCTRATALTVSNGGGTLYTRAARCHPELSERAWALVRLPGVRIRILVDRECPRCSGPVARYASPAGIRAVVRALRPR
jgi:hypothetical protein